MRLTHVWVAVLGLLLLPTVVVAQADAPTIELFYGETQTFGQLGQPQRFVNVLGTVSPAVGVQLSYVLNGGEERPLMVGPTPYRLAAAGDFNIDLPTTALRVGENELVVLAVDGAGQKTAVTMLLEFDNSAQWPLPYSIDWATVENLTDVVQVVDGEWALTPDGVRPMTLGYDRLLAIGDQSWRDYEVTVPITIHGADPRFQEPSYGASVGVAFRWNGHSKRDVTQPDNGWWPLGAFGQIQWVALRQQRFRLAGNKLELLGETADHFKLAFDKTYIMKMRVESLPDGGSFYSMKVWEETMSEPKDWQFSGHQHAWDPLGGSLLLVAHHVDATFGNVTVLPLAQRSSWQLLVDFVPYLAQLPLLLVCFWGVWVVCRERRHQLRVKKYVGLAIALLIAYLAGLPLLAFVLPPHLHGRGWGTNEIGLTLLAGQVLLGLVLAVGVGLLMWVAFGRQQVDERPPE